MIQCRFILFKAALLTLFLVPAISQASLLIKPFRAVLDEKRTTAEITLLNNSSETRTYNIQWNETRQTISGGYIDITENPFAASDYIRHSPRQVTIKPGEYQKIKLRLRMPRDLAAGEYRSHLMMKAVANLPKVDDSKTKGMKVQIIPQLSFTIPILVRKGNLDVKTDISSIKVNTDKNNKHKISVLIDHQGEFSTYGSLYAYMKVGNSKVEQIGEAHNIAVFRESKQRQAQITLQVPKIPDGAVVQVLYKGDDEFEGQILGKAAIRY